MAFVLGWALSWFAFGYFFYRPLRKNYLELNNICRNTIDLSLEFVKSVDEQSKRLSKIVKRAEDNIPRPILSPIQMENPPKDDHA